jgi:hypothetical protein
MTRDSENPVGVNALCAASLGEFAGILSGMPGQPWDAASRQETAHVFHVPPSVQPSDR